MCAYYSIRKSFSRENMILFYLNKKREKEEKKKIDMQLTHNEKRTRKMRRPVRRYLEKNIKVNVQSFSICHLFYFGRNY